MPHDLLINLLHENKTILDSSAMQLDLTKTMLTLKSIISEKIENITDKSEKQKTELFPAQSRVKGNIITKSEKFFDAPEKITESVTEEKSKKESDQPILIWVKVSEERFNLIKKIINENKDLGTTINNKRYTLKDTNDLVNKIAKNKAINFYNNNLVKKAEQIPELDPPSPDKNC